MKLMTANGEKEFKNKSLDFTNIMCDLEDNGVDIMALMDEDKRNNMKIFSTMRAITGALVGESDLKKAGKILSEHLANGGQIDDVMDAFVEVMNSAGFGEAEKTE